MLLNGAPGRFAACQTLCAWLRSWVNPFMPSGNETLKGVAGRDDTNGSVYCVYCAGSGPPSAQAG
jgi:hypothetical protein